MSFIASLGSTAWSPGPRRDLLIASGMAGAAVLAVMTDCILYQMMTGGPDPGLAMRWLVGAVAPWAVVFVILRTRLAALGGRPSWAEAGLLAGALVASTLLDTALIPPLGLEELAGRLKSRIPLAAFIPLAARLRLELGSPRPRPKPASDRRFAGARLVTAAGNYVEVEGPSGRRILRMTLAEAEKRLDPARCVRIHRSTLVAVELIARLERDRNGVVGVRLTDGRSLRVGPSYRARVRAAVG
ncbi:MAG: LytTR family DNA-binding domain-containing protein [Phenylobacterium sp.]